MSNSVRPHRRQRTRLPCPWDSPGKNTGVGCHFLLQCRKVKSESEVSQSCLTPSDPMDCSPPGSSVHGIFQAKSTGVGCHKELDDGIKFASSTTASVPSYPEILFSLITTKQLCDCLWNTDLSRNILPVFPLGAELIQPWAFSVSAIAVVVLVRNVLCIELRSRLTVISLETWQSFSISLHVRISWRL